jgi:hypothetical protein
MKARPSGAEKRRPRLALAFHAFPLISLHRSLARAVKRWNGSVAEYSIALQGLKQAVYLR